MTNSEVDVDGERRLIPGYPGYTATADGRIYGPEGTELRTLIQYPRVRVQAGPDERKSVPIHTLVALAFHGDRPAGAEIDHINCDPFDSSADNLRYVTGEVNRGRRTNVSFNSFKTHCKRGHPFDEANTYRPRRHPDRRSCRACHRADVAAARQRAPGNSGRDHSSPTIVTIEIPADFEGEATFTITPNRPEPEQPLPTNSAAPEEPEA